MRWPRSASTTCSEWSDPGNFHVTNAMVAAGSRFVAARHEGGAATMADAYARTSGKVAAVTRSPGLRPDERHDRDRRGGQEPHTRCSSLPPR